MPILKAQLHTHTKQDPREKITYTERELIDHAANLDYQILAITCHNVMIFNEQLADYAKEKGILLIPGIEKSIEKKHVLILNATVEAQHINTFKQLRKYKKQHPESLIVAAHPFFWHRHSLKHKLIENIDLFDVIEDNYLCCERFNWWNRKARQVAKEFNLPVIGTSDTHMLKYMDNAYSLIDCDEKTPEAVIKAIKNHKVQVVSEYLRTTKMFTISANIMFKNFLRKALLLP